MFLIIIDCPEAKEENAALRPEPGERIGRVPSAGTRSRSSSATRAASRPSVSRRCSSRVPRASSSPKRPRLRDDQAVTDTGRPVVESHTAAVLQGDRPLSKSPSRRRNQPAGETAGPQTSTRSWPKPTVCRFRTRCRFAQESCASAEPPRIELSPGHEAACFFPLPVTTLVHPPDAGSVRELHRP